MKARFTLVFALALWGCADDGPSCPDVSSEPSRFVYDGVYDGVGTCEPDFCEIDFPPREGATDFELEVDRPGGVVYIRYQRDGVTVEERWRITSVESS